MKYIYTMSNNVPPQNLVGIIKSYLDILIQGNKRDSTPEFEVRFGTMRGMKRISRLDYDSVIKRLLSSGYNISTLESYLRINSEYTNPNTGAVRVSRVRAELSGMGDIAEYCRKNDIVDFHNSNRVQFVEKQPAKVGETEILPYNANDFNFRAALSIERNVTNTRLTQSTVDSWKDNKKTFRYITRHRLSHPDDIVSVDISIVKDSMREGRFMKPTYTFEEARVVSSPETYEIEIEINNSKVGIATQFNTPELLVSELKKTIMLVMSGFQGTNYPVSYSKQQDVLNNYMKVLWGNNWKGRIFPKNFVGPSSYTLHTKNIAEINEDAVIPNIRTDYTVTDKADGERKLLYIADKGDIYLIDTNMNAQFTGAICMDDQLINTIIDGEHIAYDKSKRFINMYAAFDIYYISGKDVRKSPFLAEKGNDPNTARYPLLKTVMSGMKTRGITPNSKSPMRFEVKEFYTSSDTVTIFQACGHLLGRVETLEYETDGLIFTPAYFGVGSNKRGDTTKPYKRTWEHSFKWKPVEQNTIDFLVTIQRGTDGRENVKSIFQGGSDMSAASQITQYKTAVLRVGFDESVHGYINPCQNIIDGNIPDAGNPDDEDGYKPVQFFPSNPSDNTAGICNILLETAKAGEKVLFTEERQAIEDNTIVEFRYDAEKPFGWKWVPLRVRYDKTADLRSGGKNFGNAYHVANSNWQSIHNPITQNMISTGQDIPEHLGDDDVYYNRVSGSSSTRALRDFHNLYVKKKLITSVSKRGDTLIDLAVGKGGDIPKWISSKLKFVFGIDVSPDNIENRLDGVCARYLNYRKKFKNMPEALFVIGDSSVNIRNTDAIFSDKGKKITRAVFGEGPKDAKQLGDGVYKQYGIGEKGFDICSIQFAIHYMFEGPKSLHNLLRNVSETTKVGGYFIGTCYDGNTVFSMLEGKEINESIDVYQDEKKVWEVTKRYNSKTFSPDSSSLGYAIDVYQETINKSFREYLVNFEYLDRIMENYGFVRINIEKAKDIGLPGVSGSFRDLYSEMRREIERNPKSKNEYGTALDMSVGEQTVSFLNKYFVYVKKHSVDANAVSLQMMGQTQEEDIIEIQDTDEAEKVVEVEQEKSNKKPRRLKKKLVLKG
jgi:hypothetical protein